MARSFNIGQDCTIDILCSNKQTYSFSTIGADLLGFDADPEVSIVMRKPLSNNGYERRRRESTGWKGSITVGRINGDFEALEAQQASLYHTGQDDLTFTIHQTIKNKDGSGTISEYQYTNCTLWMSKGPNYRMGEDTVMTLDFRADDCIVIQK